MLVETESFKDKGGWQVDQQFMDLMGSPYLIAHGMGIPVKDASTTINVEEAAKYHIYVRTYNWTSVWSDMEGPGAFKVKVNGKALSTVLGTRGKGWMWQYAGVSALKKGDNTLALSDLKGFDGRCDAIWITTDKESVPPTDVKELEAFRRVHGTLPEKPSDGGSFTPRSPGHLQSERRNINRLLIGCPFRVPLSPRLTLIRLALFRKPWVFGERVSTRFVVTYAYIFFSGRSSTSHNAPSAPTGMLPYHSY